MKAKPTGRPSKATPETLTALLAIVEKGVTLRTAADAIGVARQTLWEWRRDPAFLTLLRAARAKGEIALVERVTTDPENSRGAQIILERSYFERWRRRTETTVKTDPIDTMTADELRTWVAQVAAAEGLGTSARSDLLRQSQPYAGMLGGGRDE